VHYLKILILYDYPPKSSGLSVLGESSHKGLEKLGHTVDPHSLFDPQGIHSKLANNKYDVCLGIGYWNDAPRQISLPKKFDVPTALWWVSEANIPKYQDIIPKADLLLVTSEYSKEIFEKYVPESKPKVLYIGCDTDFYNPDNANPSKTFSTFISSGEVKGAEEALMAVYTMATIYHEPFKYIIHSPHTEYRLEKQYMMRLSQIIKDHGIEKYTALVGGMKFPKEKMPALYKTLWFYLAPLRMACFGIPLIEAGACGIPTIAGNWKPMSEIIVDGETGFLVPHMAKAIIPKFMEGVWFTEEYKMIDYVQLSYKIEELLSNESLRNKMGMAARKRVVEHFNITKQIKKLEGELLKICQ